MDGILDIIILGIIQGLTEFLPVSSSGHLEIAKFILDDDSVGEQSLMTTVVLHFATALSTMVVFRKDIMEIISKIFAKADSSLPFVLKIMVSMIPAAIVGIVFEDLIDSLFNGNLILVASMLIVTGLLLFIADRAKNTIKDVGYKEALIIGISQAIAILPGISRSGATISTAVMLGIDRSKAARFSFLMVVPLIFGKMAKDLMDGEFGSSQINLVELGVGFTAAFFTGLVACTWMIKLVKNSQLKYFSFYCFIVAILVFVFVAI